MSQVQKLEVPRLEVVKDADRVTQLKELLNEVAPNEASAGMFPYYKGNTGITLKQKS